MNGSATWTIYVPMATFFETLPQRLKFCFGLFFLPDQIGKVLLGLRNLLKDGIAVRNIHSQASHSAGFSAESQIPIASTNCRAVTMRVPPIVPNVSKSFLSPVTIYCA